MKVPESNPVGTGASAICAPYLKKLRIGGLFLFFLSAINPVTAQSQDFKTRICSCSSSSAFAWHAENAALSELPLLFEGSQEVYVLNPLTEDVRAFTVRREMTGIDVGFGDEFWTTEVIPGPGDASVVDGLFAVITAIRDFEVAVPATIRLEDQPNPPQPAIGSATDLVGPENSSASFNRTSLVNWLSDFMSQQFNDAIEAAETGDFGDSFLDVFSAAVQLIMDFLGPNQQIWIEAADGTKILARLTETAFTINTDGLIDGLRLSFEVDPGTVSGPGFNAVPQSPGEFGGLEFSGGAIGGLGRLALRLGATITFGPGGGTCSGTLTCEISGGV
ncbi:MAG TPA: hypothetical protein VJ904_11305, partial [Tichowtungia sp.]|nr:hypothetical protein [Tichowtungia sp.]